MTIRTSYSTPADGAVAVHALLTLLTAYGWTVPAWSDGTTLTTPGTALTVNPYVSGASGAGNLGNANAWFRVTAPGGTREWLFQRKANNQTWTVSRSRTGFTGGTPLAATLPTSTSTVTFISDAALFSATPGRWLISLDDVLGTWTAFSIVIGGGNAETVIFDEGLLAGSYPTAPVADVDPYLSCAYYGAMPASTGWKPSETGANAPRVYKRFRHGLTTNEGYVLVSYLFLTPFDPQFPTAPAPVYGFGLDPYNSTEVPLRIPVGRITYSAAPRGWCGYAASHRWSTVAGRANGQTLTDGVDYWIYCGGAWIPWDATAPVI